MMHLRNLVDELNQQYYELTEDDEFYPFTCLYCGGDEVIHFMGLPVFDPESDTVCPDNCTSTCFEICGIHDLELVKLVKKNTLEILDRMCTLRQVMGE